MEAERKDSFDGTSGSLPPESEQLKDDEGDGVTPKKQNVYDSCERAAIMYSLIGACKVLGKNPEKWLTYVLKNIGKTKKEDLHKLLPQEWEEQ